MVESWNPLIHGKLVLDWARERNWDANLSDYPKTGIVVERKVMGFLYRTDSTVGYVDSLIVDPHVNRRELPKLLDRLATELYTVATNSGCRVVWLNTTLPSIARRARAIGFTSNPSWNIGWKHG